MVIVILKFLLFYDVNFINFFGMCFFFLYFIIIFMCFFVFRLWNMIVVKFVFLLYLVVINNYEM